MAIEPGMTFTIKNTPYIVHSVNKYDVTCEDPRKVEGAGYTYLPKSAVEAAIAANIAYVPNAFEQSRGMHR